MSIKKLPLLLKLFIVLIFTINLNGASSKFTNKMNYEVDYKKALQKAKDSNKPMMVVMSTKSCPWCKKFENQTLKKDMIHDIVSKEFIAVSLNRDKDQFPQQFFAKVVPTVFFIDPNDEKAYDTSYGYKNKKVFSKIVQESSKKYRSLNK